MYKEFTRIQINNTSLDEIENTLSNHVINKTVYISLFRGEYDP